MKDGNRNLNLTKMNENISQKQLRQFGFLIGFAFPLIIGWLIPYLSGHFFRSWTLFIALPSLFIGITKPILLIYPYKAWMALGHFLGFINSKLILSLVFILVLLPLSFILKLFSYDPLRIKNISRNTYKQIKKNHKIDLTRIF